MYSDYVHVLRSSPLYGIPRTPNVLSVGKFQNRLALASCLEDLLTALKVRSVLVHHAKEIIKEGVPIDPPEAAVLTE